MGDIPIAGSAFHALDRPRAGHARARPLTVRQEQSPIDLTVMLRERPGAPTVQQTLVWVHSQGPHRSKTREDALASQLSYAAPDRDRVVAWARASGMQLVAEDPTTRRLTLRAPATRAASLFGVRLEQFRHLQPSGTTVEYRGHLGPVRLPAAIADAVEGVFGLDDRPVASPRLRGLSTRRPGVVSYDPPEIARVYRYPRLPNGGEGVHLVAGMIELGGVTHGADVKAAFARLGLHPPAIVHVPVDGAVAVADPDGADVEVALDYQVIGTILRSMAPKAQLTIVSYDAPNSERGFIDAAATAASDRRLHPAATSISWGSSEDNFSLRGMRALDATFANGSVRGLTYSAAAGDGGSMDNRFDGMQHPEFPASSPHVWSCGGTTLLATRDGILSETVWNEIDRGQGAAGSGVSGVFAPPGYQVRAGIRPRSANTGRSGRGIPDGSGVADPVTGWNVLALGRMRTTGGTSAVAPMYTALWTLIAALRGERIGLPHPALYAARGRDFTDITRGDTGGPYAAHRGWDAASGWGSPNGVAIARTLGARSLGARAPRRGAEDSLAL
ncbi:MAG: protease pro-enzyme activation domain-containing protein [Candidatus Dormibacteria bacterium]